MNDTDAPSMGERPEVLVISFAGPHGRKAFQERQLKRLGLPVTFIDAATPDTLPEEKLNRLANAWARPLRSVEVALTQSHVLAWQQIVHSGKPALILEDDAVLCNSTPDILDALMRKPGLEFVQLETFVSPKRVGMAAEALGVKDYALHRLYRDRGGAAAYLVWPAAAKKLLTSVEDRYPPADAAIFLAPGITRHQLVPAGAIQIMHLSPDHPLFGDAKGVGGTSVAATPRPGYTSRAHWLRHKLRRLSVSLRVFGRDLSGLGKSQNRTVDFTGD